ncbi:molybdenum cofactor biosysynthesis protein [Polaribacter pacificus]|uniref:Molybdenum cofactor biosysynthesis protein n=1 Tax=Polaribacter pacificus TaxID=1775173 RepID=A0A917HV39_9FLAO|nr:MOSC domain-containing protein [Polaribacter pacificus]GGG91538.1 molybdenum cofactor biosysynthesis protein [Polaribacter pacificus]
MKIISTNTGEQREIEWKGKQVTTGIFKFSVDEPIFLDLEDVRGDAICNRENHGGIDQAIYGYSLKHYEYWKTKYPNLDWQFGMFGENLTIDDLDETKTHVGDVFKVGAAMLEVTKARNPCMKLGVRFNDMSIVKQFWNTSMCGVYFKVLQTGLVKSGEVFEQIKSCPENPTIAEVYQAKKIEKGIN